MFRYRIVKKVLLVLICTVGGIFLIGFIFFYSKFNTVPYEWAWRLSDKVETIEVVNIRFACDCADFTYRRTSPVDLDTLSEKEYFFIEAADRSLPTADRVMINDSAYSYNYLRLTGRFYTDRGISRTYDLKTPEKPEPARVFRYDKIEYKP